jgi:hypothetical protein
VFEKRMDAYYFVKQKYYPNLVLIASCRAFIGYYILAKEAYFLMATEVFFFF